MQILMRMVCETKSGYICNFKMYCGQKLKETILSILEHYNYLWYHIYLDNYYKYTNYYNSTKFEFLICCTIWKNWGVPHSLKNIKLAIGETSFWKYLYEWCTCTSTAKKTNVYITIHSAIMKDSNCINCLYGNFI